VTERPKPRPTATWVSSTGGRGATTARWPCLEDSLAIDRELGDPHGQAEALRELGVTLRALGRPEEARAHWRQALAIFKRLQSADADQVRALLAADPG